MNKKEIRLSFKDFTVQNKTVDFIYDQFPFLQEYYTFIDSSVDPDYVYYNARQRFIEVADSSRLNSSHYNVRMPELIGDYVKIFHTGERIAPRMDKCDYAFSFYRGIDSPNHFRLPNWVTTMFVDGHKPEDLLSENLPRYKKTKFCAYLYSNTIRTTGVALRRRFAHALNKYKQVDCAGTDLNNTGYTVPRNQTLEFLKDYKFVISFENQAFDGYCTEKVSNPLLVGCIPIYWGDPTVCLDFNTERLINCYDFKSPQAAIEFVKEVDTNNKLFDTIVAKSCYNNNTLPTCAQTDLILAQWHKIFQSR